MKHSWAEWIREVNLNTDISSVEPGDISTGLRFPVATGARTLFHPGDTIIQTNSAIAPTRFFRVSIKRETYSDLKLAVLYDCEMNTIGGVVSFRIMANRQLNILTEYCSFALDLRHLLCLGNSQGAHRKPERLQADWDLRLQRYDYVGDHSAACQPPVDRPDRYRLWGGVHQHPGVLHHHVDAGVCI